MTEHQIADYIKVAQENMPMFISWGLRLISAAAIIIAGRVIGNWAHNRVAAINRLDATLRVFLGGFLKYTIQAIAIITVLGQFGVQTASLLAVLGAAGLAIGLAMQGTLSNVAAGMMILILRPFNIGDYITSGSIGGTVKALGLFGTELATPDNVYIFVPNGKIWDGDIWNYSRNGERRQDINFGISYDDNIGRAREIVLGVLNADERVKQAPDDRKPQVMASNMGDFSIDLIARFWCSKDDYWNLKWDLTKAIKEALDANGITIPFPTRTLHMVEDGNKEKKQAAA
ncbi:MAG: mechanosensitive ion channel [Alphaproteobacteria bacterium]|nr:mechanosensitive ion channel [Alphaproteobacteria bacterium]